MALDTSDGVRLAGEDAHMIVNREGGEYTLDLARHGTDGVGCRVRVDQLRYALDALDARDQASAPD